MRYWINTNQKSLFVLGIIIWMAGSIFLALSFKTQNIAVASLVMVIINIITLVVVSYLAFHEPLNSRALIGIVLGLIAVALLEIR